MKDRFYERNPNSLSGDEDPSDFVDRRHARVYRAVQRSRRSAIPTWVYALTLAVFVGAWIWWIAVG